MKRSIAFITAALLLVAALAGAQEGKVDFSGEWVLNQEKSDLPEGRGGRGGRISSKLNVEQEKDQLTVESFRRNRDGEEVSSETTYLLDGKEHEIPSNFGSQVSTAEWSSDGETLTISSTITMSRGGSEFTMESTEEWSLNDGFLIIESTRSTPRGEMTSKAVYEKAGEEE